MPPPELVHLVRHFWFVSWDVTAPQIRENLPHPAVHLVFEKGRAEIVGVPTSRFAVELSGQDRVIGVRFHPGAFSSLAASLQTRPPDASYWTDRRLPASDVFGEEIDRLHDLVVCLPWPDCLQPLSEFLTFVASQMDPLSAEATLARRLVGLLESEADLKRVEQLAAREGISVRSMQRLFRRHVGVSPKWVIRRFRLHEALARIDAGERADWAGLAVDLGYYDQSHFINDFVALAGCTPEQYGFRPLPL